MNKYVFFWVLVLVRSLEDACTSLRQDEGVGLHEFLGVQATYSHSSGLDVELQVHLATVQKRVRVVSAP